MGLYNTNDEWVTRDVEVETVAVDYFSSLFTSTTREAFEEFLSEVPTSITDHTNEWLTAMATEEEVREVLL